MDFSVASSSEGNLQVVTSQGDLDVHAAPQMLALLMPLMQPGSRTVIEMSGTPFMDSSGLASIIEAAARARVVDGYLCMAAPSGRVKKVLQITGVDTLIDVFDSLESAQIGR
jgi:anti-sigma B factor antagonist